MKYAGWLGIALVAVLPQIIVIHPALPAASKTSTLSGPTAKPSAASRSCPASWSIPPMSPPKSTCSA